MWKTKQNEWKSVEEDDRTRNILEGAREMLKQAAGADGMKRTHGNMGTWSLGADTSFGKS